MWVNIVCEMACNVLMKSQIIHDNDETSAICLKENDSAEWAFREQ